MGETKEKEYLEEDS